jgi:DNA primase
VALAQWGCANAGATLGTACTADHVAKLFRFTDSVVFSFDGDAAGRRAAARALEAALPHATDLRTIRFLFLPTEHDPDSYVRELGPEAFDQAVAQAVPLSSQLVVHAAADCDLATAEGRSKMLTQAQPLIELLPEGLLREQLLAELAQRGGVALDVLEAHWARRAARTATKRHREHGETPPPVASAKPRARAMSTGRAAPQIATLLDRTAWLLARHAGLWLDLSADDHEFLASQPAPYAGFFGALERVLHDHGPMAMESMLAELERDVDAESLHPLITRMRSYHDIDEERPQAEVAAVLHHLRLQAIRDELNLITESGTDLSEAAIQRMKELLQLQSMMKRKPPGTS